MRRPGPGLATALRLLAALPLALAASLALSLAGLALLPGTVGERIVWGGPLFCALWPLLILYCYWPENALWPPLVLCLLAALGLLPLLLA